MEIQSNGESDSDDYSDRMMLTTENNGDDDDGYNNDYIIKVDNNDVDGSFDNGNNDDNYRDDLNRIVDKTLVRRTLVK